MMCQVCKEPETEVQNQFECLAVEENEAMEDDEKDGAWEKVVKQGRKKKNKKAKDICAVGGHGPDQKTDVTVDSAAEESVCPQQWAEMYETVPLKGEAMKFVNANGGRINHYGSKKVGFNVGDEGVKSRMLGLGFEVTDVKKPLLAVFRICEQGNRVQFGPQPADNYIQNVATGEKVHMKREGNSYVLQGEIAQNCPFTRPGVGR